MTIKQLYVYQCPICNKSYFNQDEALTCEVKCNDLHCSFCGKSQKDVKYLINGPTVYICNECVFLCFDILIDKVKDKLE